MKPCALVNAWASTVVVSVLAFAACGPSSAEQHAAHPPSDPAPPPAPAAPLAGEPPASGGSGRPSPTGAGTASGRHPSEKRTTQLIADIVKANRQKARDCYDRVLRDKPDMKGDLVVQFVLAPSGEVQIAHLNEARSDIKEPAVVNCVISVIRSLSFPPSSRGMETKVNYPYNFNP